MEGSKFDKDKIDWSRLPVAAVEEELKVLEHGAKKYGENNWMNVPSFKRRYVAATFRHVAAYLMGEENDPESGLHHLAHVRCNCAFLMWRDKLDPTD